jgi:hypothetical protein
MNHLTKRVEQLEQAMGETTLKLFMPDGSERTISTGRWFAMMDELGKGIVKPDTQAILDSVGDDGSEGRMREVVQCLAAGQAQIAAADAAEGTEGAGLLIQ